ncbi:MAG: hypothetical protein OXU45_08315 [Candidatus Melainabacteria bacterium]|nr:hypothetical protein [Candidatus Melainabacteria bacterium]
MSAHSLVAKGLVRPTVNDFLQRHEKPDGLISEIRHMGEEFFANVDQKLRDAGIDDVKDRAIGAYLAASNGLRGLGDLPEIGRTTAANIMATVRQIANILRFKPIAQRVESINSQIDDPKVFLATMHEAADAGRVSLRDFTQAQAGSPFMAETATAVLDHILQDLDSGAYPSEIFPARQLDRGVDRAEFECDLAAEISPVVELLLANGARENGWLEVLRANELAGVSRTFDDWGMAADGPVAGLYKVLEQAAG